MKRYVNKLKKLKESSNNFQIITLKVRDNENRLKDLLEYIKGIGNIGHSFSIIVDPDDSDYKKEFFWDGDGSDYIKDIKEEK
jgi:hypothetical protein